MRGLRCLVLDVLFQLQEILFLFCDWRCVTDVDEDNWRREEKEEGGREEQHATSCLIIEETGGWIGRLGRNQKGEKNKEG